MNDLKSLSNAMKLATEVVLHEKYKDLKALKNFTCRIGTGSATNVTRRGRTPSTYHYVLTYGIKMLESKQTKKSALMWTTGKEIMERNYFNRKPSYKDFVISVILHEYAHAIQFAEEGHKRGSVHNAHFYGILDGFYEKNYHVELDKYLSAFPAYTTAKYLNDERTLTSADLVGAKYLEFKGSNGKEIVKIVKINRTRVACIRTTGQKTSIPFGMIDKVYVKESDLPNGSFSSLTSQSKLVRKTRPMRPQETITASYISSNDIKYITILTRSSKSETYRVDRLNPKNVVGKDIVSGDIYNIPYGLIVKCHKELPKNMSEVPDIVKKPRKEPKYNRNNLHLKQVVEIELKGEMVKFEIVKLNTKKFKGKKVNKEIKYIHDIPHESIYDIPYGCILKTH